MTQVKRKAVSLVLAFTMLISLVAVMAVGSFAATDSGITEAAGWLESAYVEWAPISGADGYNVYVKSSSASDWARIDDMLIRQYKDYLRADAVGLKAGSYEMKVVPVAGGAEQSDKALVSGSLTVLAHDRSGYAFVNGSSSGAYNNDGTLKSDARVIYITEQTKDTVSLVVKVGKNDETRVGLQEILNGYKKQTDSRPLCVRIIGNITDLAVLDKGDIVVDNNIQGLTIEGIGEDAVLNGFGIRLKGCSNVEIRNLATMNCDSNEGDNIGLQQDNDHIWVHNCDFFYGHAGSDSDQAKGDGALDTKKSAYVTHSYNHFWDSGKCNLQGMTSETTSNYITYHHNWYDHADSRMPRVRTCTVHVYNNFYDGVAKYAIGATSGCSIFVENNYFLNTKQPMLISKQGSDISKDPESDGTFSGEDGGIIKAYGNTITGTGYGVVTYQQDSTNFDCYLASSRNEQVPSSVKTLQGGTTYTNFDTASDFYSYNVQSAEEAMETVKQYAGRVNGGDFEWNFTDADNTDYDVNTALKSALTSYKTSLVSVGGNNDGYVGDNSGSGSGDSGSGDNGSGSGSGDSGSGDSGSGSGGTVETPTGAIVHNFGTSGTNSSFFNISGNTSTSKGSVVYNGMALSTCLKMESSTSISFTAGSAGTLTLVFNSANSKNVKVDGEKYSFTTNEFTLEIAAGAHTITKADTANLFYMMFEPEGSSSGSDNGNSGSGDSGNGSDSGSDNGGSGTVSGVTSGTYSFSTADITDVPSADKTPLTEGTKFANDFFVIGGTVTQILNTTDGGVKALELAKAAGGWISFTIGADATVTIDVSSTGNDKTSVFAIYDSNSNAIANTEGVSEIYGGMSAKKTFTYNLSAGTYLLLSPSGTDYSGRGVRLYSIVAVVGGGSDNTDTPDSGNTETPDNGNTETPGGDNTETPDNGNTETPDTPETPDDGNTETPENPSDDKNEGGEQDGASDDKSEDEEPEEKLNFFQRIFRAIANFFRMLFGGKKK